ncbi:MAG TPA: type II secretion system minor pseudopilin GspK [Burkholderiales bacterium]|jgi:general secretion pathway protein K|nr:type II secretion system minor pseudopilin GspK [Burkholderiales bacterium]
MNSQRGSAVVLAMLVLAVATTLIIGTLWQQNALIRETENDRAYSQARWLLRGAIDWAGVILREDARTTSVDHRGEPWAVPLADTRLNENDGRPAAYLAGTIDDEQAKFNLRNLLTGTDLNAMELQSLRRLLSALRIEERYADKIGERLVAAQRARSSEPAIGLAYVDDLLQVGLAPEQVQRLKAFVTILPEPTQLNVNTASAEVLSARISGLELTDARRIVAARDRAYFKDMGDALARLREAVPSVTEAGLSVTTRYFSVDGLVTYGPARLAAHALVRREPVTLEVLWMKEAS